MASPLSQVLDLLLQPSAMTVSAGANSFAEIADSAAGSARWSGVFDVRNSSVSLLRAAVYLQDYLDADSARSLARVLQLDVSNQLAQYVDVSGVRLRLRQNDSAASLAIASNVVLTPTARLNLSKLAFAVSCCDSLGSSAKPILIEGPPGSGKTTLLRYLAGITGWGHDLVELHLDDAADGKALLGQYVCSDVPGEFKWQPGAITAAATSGRWVLIEDIDRAPFEVLAALGQLMESRTLIVPGQPRAIAAHPGFQLFATRSAAALLTAGSGHNTAGRLQPISGPMTAFIDNWFRVPFVATSPPASSGADSTGLVETASSSPQQQLVVADDMPSQELRLMVASLHPNLPGQVLDGLLACYGMVQAAYSRTGASAASGSKSASLSVGVTGLERYGRSLSARDMLRLARRVAQLTPVARRAAAAAGSNSNIFLTENDKLSIVHEALSVSGGHIPDLDTKRALGRALALAWGLTTDAADALLDVWKPELGYTSSSSGNGSGSGSTSTASSSSGVQLQVGSISLPVASSLLASSMALGRMLEPLPSYFAATRHSLRLLERLAACVALDEPALLVGETGNGKTSVIQALAAACGQQLLVYNVNAQSDSGDLVGGFKPVHLKQVAMPLLARFETLFTSTFGSTSSSSQASAGASSSNSSNTAFVDAVRTAAHGEQWPRTIGGFMRAVQRAQAQLSLPEVSSATGVQAAVNADLRSQWSRFGMDVQHFERQYSILEKGKGTSTGDSGGNGAGGAFAFTFVEGILVQALRAGHWILLDEVNLASSETLQRLAGLLEGGSVTLTERGDADPVPRHHNFRVFAAMNPATDFGKRDLPPALRSRFIELYVEDVESPDDLAIIAQRYVSAWPGDRGNSDPAGLVQRIVAFYLQARKLAAPITGVLRDGASSRPHFSLRSLTRALRAASDLVTAGFPVHKAVSEGVSMSFLTQLEDTSASTLMGVIQQHFGHKAAAASAAAASASPAAAAGKAKKKDKQAALAAAVIARLSGGNTPTASSASGYGDDDDCADAAPSSIPKPRGMGDAVLVHHYWLAKGPLQPVDMTQPEPGSGAIRYVMVPSVQRHVRSLARAVACGRQPILLQGPTSAGKTSMVEYLAHLTGHDCVRINNHEHTDIAEYLGSYMTSPTGKLVFAEGLLVQALRKGQWLILDELNLAPSEVLEALNRLLDDNRELFLPETQEIVKPHPHFMLFATQNPVGGYGGRKPLSKAFRNRFVELHVDDIPAPELHAIIMQRSKLPSSFVERMISVMQELQRVRQGSDVFAGRHGFITPRDLLRWASRQPRTYTALAEEGFMLLAERLRLPSEKETVKACLEKACKVSIDMNAMYNAPFATVLADAGAVDTGMAVLGDGDTVAGSTSTGDPDSTSGAGAGSKRGAASVVHSGTQPSSKRGRDLDSREAPSEGEKFTSLVQERLQSFLRLIHDQRTDPGTNMNDTDAEAASSEVNLCPGAIAGTEGLSTITVTNSLRRLFTLVGRCIAHDEPVLLVGDTGAGKTTVIQLFALLLQQPLHIVNCHAHSETADFLGSLRPLRNKAVHAERLRSSVLEYAATLPAAAFGAPDAASDGIAADAGDMRASVLESLAAATPEVLIATVHQLSTALATLPAGTVDTALAPKLAALHAEAVEESRRCASLFEWTDGPLVTSMRAGHFFLLDEASLAEDAVLERLNSVLEPSRTITLAEKADDAHAAPGESSVIIKAASSFRIFATMNPGGDFGKRELSPALRNRFTEIWVPAIHDVEDLLLIVADKAADVSLRMGLAAQHLLSPLQQFVEPLVRFVQWFDEHASSGRLAPGIVHGMKQLSLTHASKHASNTNPGSAKTFQLTLRDLHAWLSFMGTMIAKEKANEGGDGGPNNSASTGIVASSSPATSPWEAYAHGACLVLLDGLGLGMGLAADACETVRRAAASVVASQAPAEVKQRIEGILAASKPAPEANMQASAPSHEQAQALAAPGCFGVPPFLIPTGRHAAAGAQAYALHAPTTKSNLVRVLRALQLRKPVLLEGSPGVGKTSLIEALARASGHRLVRINLSDQTDVSDLFGQDLPAVSSSRESSDGGAGPSSSGSNGGFAWCDGVFLQALKAGDWVLLDELNLAPQAVLEGLNAVLDHRGTVFIPELDMSFACPAGFQIFATQNPVTQGGGRKGLPKSFLNRFAKVYVQPLSGDDQYFIARTLYPQLDVTPSSNGGDGSDGGARALLHMMVEFNMKLHEDTMGSDGSSSPSGIATRPLYGAEGRPWEFNLRDLFRWCDSIVASQAPGHYDPGATLDYAYLQRLRRPADRAAACARFLSIFGHLSAASTTVTPSPLGLTLHSTPVLRLSQSFIAIDDAVLPRAHVPGAWSASPSNNIDGIAIAASVLTAACASANSIARYGEAGTGGSGDAGVITPGLLRPLYHAMLAVDTRSPVLLVGRKSSGKTATLKHLAALCGVRLRVMSLTPSTDATELIGCFEQADPSRKVADVSDCAIGLARAALVALSHISDINGTAAMATGIKQSLDSYEVAQAADFSVLEPTIAALLVQLTSFATACTGTADARLVSGGSSFAAAVAACRTRATANLAALAQAAAPSDATSSAAPQRGAFEWVDGALVEAMERGEWIVVDNVNFCAASVVDRLNPLLETGGSLLINECGLDADGRPRVVQPHPSFRIFFTLDQGLGDVSRALRNRCVEIAMLDPAMAGGVVLDEAAEARRLAKAIIGSSPRAKQLMPACDRVIGEIMDSCGLTRLEAARVLAGGRPGYAPVMRQALQAHEAAVAYVAQPGGRSGANEPPRPRQLRLLGDVIAAVAGSGLRDQVLTSEGVAASSSAGMSALPSRLAAVMDLVYRYHGGGLISFNLGFASSTQGLAATHLLPFQQDAGHTSDITAAIGHLLAASTDADLMAQLLWLLKQDGIVAIDSSDWLQGGVLEFLLRCRINGADVTQRAAWLLHLIESMALSADQKVLISAFASAIAATLLSSSTAAALLATIVAETSNVCAGAGDVLQLLPLRHDDNPHLWHRFEHTVRRCTSTVDEANLLLSRLYATRDVLVASAADTGAAASIAATLQRESQRNDGTLSALSLATVHAVRLNQQLPATISTAVAGIALPARLIEKCLGSLVYMHVVTGAYTVTSLVSFVLEQLAAPDQIANPGVAAVVAALAAISKPCEAIFQQLQATTSAADGSGVSISNRYPTLAMALVVLWRKAVKSLKAAWPMITAVVGGNDARLRVVLLTVRQATSAVSTGSVAAVGTSSASSPADAALSLSHPRDVLWRYGGHPRVPRTKQAFDAVASLGKLFLDLQQSSVSTGGAAGVAGLHAADLLPGAVRAQVTAGLALVLRVSSDPAASAADVDSAVATALDMAVHIGEQVERRKPVIPASLLDNQRDDSDMKQDNNDDDDPNQRGIGIDNELLDRLRLSSRSGPYLRRSIRLLVAEPVERWCLVAEQRAHVQISRVLASLLLELPVNEGATGSTLRSIERVMAVASSACRWSPLDLLQLQLVGWALQAASSSISSDGLDSLAATISDALPSLLASWHARAEAVGWSDDATTTAGRDSAQLHHAAVLAVVNAPCPMHEYEGRAYLLQLLSAHGATNATEPDVVGADVVVPATQLLLVVLAAAHAMPDTSAVEGLRSAAAAWYAAVQQRDSVLAEQHSASILQQLVSTADTRVVDAIPDLVAPSFAAVHAALPVTAAPSTVYAAAARVALARLHLLLPSSPVDPALKPGLKRQQLQIDAGAIRTRLALRQMVNAFARGATMRLSATDAQLQLLLSHTDPSIASCARFLLDASAKAGAYAVREVYRPSTGLNGTGDGSATFGSLHAEAHAFARNMCQPQRIDEMLQWVDGSQQAPATVSNVRVQVLAWTETARGFAARLGSAYQPFEDVAAPIKAAIHDLARALHSLAATPASTDGVAATTFAPASSQPVTLHQIAIKAGADRHAASTMLSEVMDAWLARQRSIEEGAAKENEDKSFKMLGETDEVRVEREFREAIPDHFKSHFGEFVRSKQEMLVEYVQPADEKHHTGSGNLRKHDGLASMSARGLALHHRRLFGAQHDDSDTAAADVDDQGRLHILSSSPTPWSCVPTLLHHMGEMSTRAQQAEAAGASASSSLSGVAGYSFYRDTNVPEAAMGVKPARAFAARAFELLLRWPNNEVLCLLLRVTDQMMKLPVTAPIAALLAGAELMVTKAQDWEVNAPQIHQLGAALTGISQLVTRWRKLELSSWSQLLIAAEQEQEEAASSLWLQLRSVFVTLDQDIIDSCGQLQQAASKAAAQILPALGSGASADSVTPPSHAAWALPASMAAKSSSGAISAADGSVEESRSDAFLRGCFESADRFIRSSSQGQFAFKISLLESLGAEIARLAGDDLITSSERVIRQRQSMILSNVSRFYAQYLPSVHEALAKIKAPVLKNVSDQVTLHRWDEQSYYAMRESAEKSHRIVFKALRLYKEVLSTTVGPVINGYSAPAKEAATERADNMPAGAVVGVKGASKKRKAAATAAASTPAAPCIAMVLTTAVAQLTRVGQLDVTAGPIKLVGLAVSLQDVRKRMHQLLLKSKSGIMGRDAIAARAECTDAVGYQAENIFSRVEDLRVSGAPRMAKQRALIDGLRSMSRMGISYLSASVPAQQTQLLLLMQVPALSVAALDAALSPLAAKSDAHFYRTVESLLRIRVNVSGGDWHKDISPSEVRRGSGFVEHMLHLLMQQRMLIGASDKQNRGLALLIDQLSTAASETAPAASMAAAASAIASASASLSSLAYAKAQLNGAKTLLRSLARTMTVTKDGGKSGLRSLSNDVIADEAVLMGLLPSPDASLSGLAPALVRRMQQLNALLAAVEGAAAGIGRSIQRLRRAVPTAPEWEAVAGTLACSSAAAELNSSDVGSAPADLVASLRASVAEAITSLSAAAASSQASASNDEELLLQPFLTRVMRALTTELSSQAAAFSTSSANGDGMAAGGSSSVASCLSTLTKEVMLAVQALVPASSSAPGLWGLSSQPEASHSTTSAMHVETADADREPADGDDASLSGTDDEEVADVDVSSATAEAYTTFRATSIPAIAHATSMLLQSLRATGAAALSQQHRDALHHCVSLLRGIQGTHSYLLADLLRFHHSLSKLSLVSASVLIRIMDEGYCMPDKQDGEGEEGDGKGDGDGGGGQGEGKFHAGTGMGEGQGQRDVSDQIDNEEQVLGLKNEQDAGAEKDKNEQQQSGQDRSKGVEMTSDFQGEMHDLSPPNEDEDEDADDKQNGHDGKEEPPEEDADREMGTADDDNARVVDEKLWEGKDDEKEEEEGEEAGEKKGPQKAESAVEGGKQKGMRAKQGKDSGKPSSSDQQAAGDIDNATEDGGDADSDDGDDGVAPVNDDDNAGADFEPAGDLGQDSASEGPDGGGDGDLPDDDDDQKKQKRKEKLKTQKEEALESDAEADDDGADKPQDFKEADAGDANDDQSQPQPQQRAEEDDETGDAADDNAFPDEMRLDRDDNKDENAGAVDSDQEMVDTVEPDKQRSDGDDNEGGEDDAAGDQEQKKDGLDAAVDDTAEQPGTGGDDQAEDAAPPSEPIPQQAPDQQQKAQQPAPGVASRSGTSKLSAGGQPQASAPDSKAQQKEQGIEEDEGAEEDEGMLGDDGDDAVGMDQVAAEGQDGAGQDMAGQAESASGQKGVWRKSAPSADTDKQQNKAVRNKPTAGLKQDRSDPLSDPSKALRQWQARMRNKPAQDDGNDDGDADDDASPATADAPEGSNVDVMAHSKGGVSMLAPRAEGENDDGDDADDKNGDKPLAPPADDETDVAGEKLDDEAVDDRALQSSSADQDAADGDDDGDDVDMNTSAKDRKKRQRAGAAGHSGAAADMMALDADDDVEGGGDGSESATPADAVLQGLVSPDDDAQADRDVAPDSRIITGAESRKRHKPDAAQSQAAGAVMDAESSTAMEAAPDVEALRASYEATMSTWTAGSGSSDALASEAWSALSAITSDPSARLCEGLRLVLEPTLASKLGGEYRSGKRINMRKVIPYIASNFRKDKIWMRRTKPSKRTYQVLLAIDDSLSMAPGNRGGGAVALEAMAVIARAMAKLEVGEIGVMSYGRHVKLLHPFESPFTDDAGARILSSFTFAQDLTRTDALLDSVTKMMDGARASASLRASSSMSGVRCMQLVFVISDGIVGSGAERERVRQWVIEAAQRGMLVVLVIVDKKATPRPASGSAASAAAGSGAGASSSAAPDAGDLDSIVSTQSVRFTNGTMVRTPYLDDFPFPYYLIIRDTKALPEALSDALRQWFELMGSRE